MHEVLRQADREGAALRKRSRRGRCLLGSPVPCVHLCAPGAGRWASPRTGGRLRPHRFQMSTVGLGSPAGRVSGPPRSPQCPSPGTTAPQELTSLQNYRAHQYGVFHQNPHLSKPIEHQIFNYAFPCTLKTAFCHMCVCYKRIWMSEHPGSWLQEPYVFCETGKSPISFPHDDSEESCPLIHFSVSFLYH